MKEISTLDFNDFIAEGVVLVDFYATWCNPCKVLEKSLKSFEVNHGIPVGKVNVDTARSVSNVYGVLGVPTVIKFDGGVEVVRYSGAMSVRQLEDRFL